VIPALFELVRPASVVDVGCGIGEWLAEFAAAGVTDLLGIDGPHVDRGKLLIEPERFSARDLAEPLEVGRRFDLAISLEVAEHLPEACAESFVASLVSLAPVVLFSAAIPYQQGTGHVNGQWPEYWQTIFEEHGYTVADCLRPRLWNNDRVSWWYRQNMLVFADRKRLADHPKLAAAVDQASSDAPLSLVHPGCYLNVRDALCLQVRAAQSLAMRHMLRLREVGLAVFPDWSEPQEQLKSRLRELLAALVAHPDRPRLSLVLEIGTQTAASVHALLHEAAAELPEPLAQLLGEGPDVSTIDAAFGRDQWEILLACLQGRVALAREDSNAIAAAGAERFPVISLTAIDKKQPFVTK
jgi:SAM-dependent methyltransferase